MPESKTTLLATSAASVVSPSEFEILTGVSSICRRMRELLQRPGLTPRQCYWYLESGLWPGVRKGGNWHLRPHRLLQEMRAAEDEVLAAHRARLAAKAEAKGANSEQQPRKAPPEAAPRTKRTRRGARSKPGQPGGASQTAP
jgi:hypothetical protein